MINGERVEVLGVRFDNLTRSEAARAIAELACSPPLSYVVKPYSEFMPRAVRNREISAILNGSTLCLPDGVGILWAAHYLSLSGGRWRALWQLPLSLVSLALNPRAVRRPLKQNMAGVDLTWAMLSELDALGATVFLLGGTRAELRGAQARVEERLKRLRVVGVHAGYFRTSGATNEDVIAQINSAAPQVLLVGMGFPLQERWIAANMDRLKVNVAVAEGGSFSFISGATRRAPAWMRRSGLEWLFRLLRQPRRIGRQMAIPVFVWMVVQERLGRSISRRGL